jgi:hypothetical protein
VQIIPVLTSFSKTIQVTSTVSAMASSSGLIEVTTTAAHGLVTGDIVQLFGTVGAVASNGQWIVTVTSATVFTLNNSTWGATYVSGGSVAHIGYSTTAFNATFFPEGISPEMTLKVKVQSCPEGQKMRWAFDDGFDPTFATTPTGPTGAYAGGASSSSDWAWSVLAFEFPDLNIQMVNNYWRFRMLWGSPVVGNTIVLSVWIEV